MNTEKRRQVFVFSETNLSPITKRTSPTKENQSSFHVHFLNDNKTLLASSPVHTIKEDETFVYPANIYFSTRPTRLNIFSPQPCCFDGQFKTVHKYGLLVKSHYLGISIPCCQAIDVPLGFSIALKTDVVVGFQLHSTLIQAQLEIMAVYVDRTTPQKEVRLRIKNNHLHHRYTLDLTSILGFLVTKE